MRDELVSVLRRPRFVLVVGGEGVSMVGDAAFDIALAWLVIQRTGSVATLAGVLLLQAAPRSLLLLLGGAVVDRCSPRLVMLVCHSVRAVAMATVAVAAAVGAPPLWQFYCLALVMGVASAFFLPASESIIPTLVDGDQLGRANAVQGLFEQSAFILGPMLGGFIVAGPGAAAVFGLNAVTFAVAAATVLLAPRTLRARRATRPGAVLRDIGEGLGHARRSHEIRLVLIVIGAATLSYAGVFAVGLPALATSLGGGAATLGLMVSGWGAGQLLGAVAASLTGLPRRWGLLIISMTLLEAAMFTTLGLVSSPWAAASILFAVGIGVSYSSDVALPTFIQSQAPPHLLGRVSSLVVLPRVVLEPVSILVIGVALAGSVQWGFAIASLPVLAVGLRLALDPRARRLGIQPRDPAHEARR